MSSARGTGNGGRSPVVDTVVGTRPQFVKAAMVSRTFEERGVDERLIHTGQHYDRELDAVFFEDLDLSDPAVNLGVGSAPPSRQTGAMMEALERYLDERPEPADVLLVYGDTNSTLAAAIVAAQHQIPLVHVEAGLRAYDRSMPEEVNRVVTDRLSSLLCAPTPAAVENLEQEGIREGVVRTGDVMRDAVRHYGDRSLVRELARKAAPRDSEEFVLATIHRPANTDDPARMRAILEGFARLDRPVLMPAHPRTREALGPLTVPANVLVRSPVRYLTMLGLIGLARAVCTDSGGVQREAYWLGVPCVTVRATTEWTETLRGGWNRLVDADPDRIVHALERTPETESPEPFGAPPGGERASVCVVEAVRQILDR